MNIFSPISNTKNVKHISSYKTSITSDARILNKVVDNYLCLDSGTVFNSSGSLGDEKEFYTDDYDLHSENSISEFKYFDSSQPIGIYDDILNFIAEKKNFKKNGDYLDIGCGKGLLLNKFSKRFPEWTLSGVEPSKNALKFYSEILPNVEIYEGMLENSKFVQNRYDLITANGVLEHVPSPISFLKILREMISDEGHLYIGVPNLKNNPADMFTYDHLFRFTEESINTCFKIAGLEIVHSRVENGRVPMWYLVKPAQPMTLKSVNIDISAAKQLVEKTLKEINEVFKSYNEAVKLCANTNKKIAVYGTGGFALIGVFYSDLSEKLIEAVMDDNDSIWGTKKLGVEVRSPDKLKYLKNVETVVFSANPCYFGLLKKKIDAIILENNLEISVLMPNVSVSMN